MYVVESGRCSSLAAKAFQGLRVFRQFVGQEFKGDETAQFGVLSVVDHSHAADTKFFDNAVEGGKIRPPGAECQAVEWGMGERPGEAPIPCVGQAKHTSSMTLDFCRQASIITQ